MSLGLARASSWAAIAGSAFVWVVLLGPIGVLVAHVSPHNLDATLGPPGALDPLWISLGASAVALGVIVGLGTPLAYLLARRRLPFPRLIEAGVVVPLLMPPLVIGLLLIFLIGQSGPVGQALSHLSGSAFGINTFFALVVAEFYEAAPYYVLSAEGAFAAVDERLEQDARLLGDRPLAAFFKVTVPLAAPGLSTGLATSWARAMGAFGAVLIVAYNPRGLPIAIDTTFVELGLGRALPYALLLVVAALPLPLLAYVWAARVRGRHLAMEPALP
ncbi:MAG: molybdate ABC transporter permease subunit [Acidimicrobiales bacterium]